MVTVLEDRYLVGRKDHQCQECGCVIAKGTEHYVQVNVWDGDISRWRVHSDCAALYWRANEKHICTWDDAYELSDFSIDELEEFRGFFPHAVCRQELRREISDLRWQKRRALSPTDTERPET